METVRVVFAIYRLQTDQWTEGQL